MRAIVYQRYGSPDALGLRDFDMPAMKDDEVLMRVHAVSVNRSDWEALTARPVYVRLGGSGFLRPKRPILSSDIAGTVQAVGTDVTEFMPGDEVLVDSMWHGLGGFRRVCVRS